MTRVLARVELGRSGPEAPLVAPPAATRRALQPAPGPELRKLGYSAAECPDEAPDLPWSVVVTPIEGSKIEPVSEAAPALGTPEASPRKTVEISADVITRGRTLVMEPSSAPSFTTVTVPLALEAPANAVPRCTRCDCFLEDLFDRALGRCQRCSLDEGVTRLTRPPLSRGPWWRRSARVVMSLFRASVFQKLSRKGQP